MTSASTYSITELVNQPQRFYVVYYPFYRQPTLSLSQLLKYLEIVYTIKGEKESEEKKSV